MPENEYYIGIGIRKPLQSKSISEQSKQTNGKYFFYASMSYANLKEQVHSHGNFAVPPEELGKVFGLSVCR